MCSRGSVIPLFVDQINSEKPLTVTNPNMTRFLMSLEEAVELVIFAFENAKPGDIMVQKAPASTIGDLAQAVKELFSSESKIKIIGTRHGEKLYETLLTAEEMLQAVDEGGYFRIPADKRDLNYHKYFIDGVSQLDDIESYDSNNADILSIYEIKKKLLELTYIQKVLLEWEQK